MNPWDQHGVRSNQPNLVHCPQELPVQHSVLNPGAFEKYLFGCTQSTYCGLSDSYHETDNPCSLSTTSVVAHTVHTNLNSRLPYMHKNLLWIHILRNKSFKSCSIIRVKWKHRSTLFSFNGNLSSQPLNLPNPTLLKPAPVVYISPTFLTQVML